MKSNFELFVEALELLGLNNNRSLEIANQTDKAFINYKTPEQIVEMAKEIFNNEKALDEALSN